MARGEGKTKAQLTTAIEQAIEGRRVWYVAWSSSGVPYCAELAIAICNERGLRYRFRKTTPELVIAGPEATGSVLFTSAGAGIASKLDGRNDPAIVDHAAELDPDAWDRIMKANRRAENANARRAGDRRA